VWREEQKQLELDNLNLQANDSSLKGQASVTRREAEVGAESAV
jgi:AsmA protein